MSDPTTHNPATGEAVPGRPFAALRESTQRLQALTCAASSWRQSSIGRRAELLLQVADALRGDRETHARLMATEMGKPLAQGRGEIDKCALVCEYYAKHGPAFLEPCQIETEGTKSYVRFDPLGVVLAIMPWNFPYWQVFRFAAPALMAGNAIALKHAPNVQGCAEAIERLLQSVHPESPLLQNFHLTDHTTGALIEHDAVAAVTFTGSTRGGRAVAARAGGALKKTVLELGGSDAYLVLEDADVEAAAAACVDSRLVNGGQSCIAAKRFIVHRARHEELTAHVMQRMGAARMGDPFKPGTTLGPMARIDLRDELHRQVTESVAAGAQLRLGGEVPARPGAWYPPTVLTNVRPGMPAHDEELFGPVASVIEAESDEAALRIANGSEFGLGAALFSSDPQRAEALAARVEAGCCFVNDFVRSDPRLPFGGIKHSGYGRELSSFGIRELVNVKTIYVK
ncbi:MAG: NAD-dependent succinate-semialdehyde dehydrogenase [Myxococcales bacterium]|nr:NAD-dependent succinate-semialdehyde dehydrogenase [Myxococcales bacterium]